MNTKRIVSVLLLSTVISISALSVGCKTPKAQPGGVYAPTNEVGQVVYDETKLALLDASYKFAYETTFSLFEYERNNRKAIQAISPEIKHAFDVARPHITDIERRWALGRRAYRTNPTPANYTTMQTVLAELNRALSVIQSQAQPVFAQVVKPNP